MLLGISQTLNLVSTAKLDLARFSVVPCAPFPSQSLDFAPRILRFLGSAQYYKAQETKMAYFQVHKLKYIPKIH